MKKNKITLDRVKLLMKYDASKTLNENIKENNIILENGMVDEANAAQWVKAGEELGAALRDSTGAEKAIIQRVLDNIGFGGIKDSVGGTVKTADELITKLESGLIKDAEIGKIKRGLLRSGDIKLAQKSANAIARLALEDVPEYHNMTKDQIVDRLKKLRSPYGDTEANLLADEIIKERANVKLNPGAKAGTETAAAGTETVAGGASAIESEVSNMEAIAGKKPFVVDGATITSVEELDRVLTSGGIKAEGDINININKIIGDGNTVKQEITKRKYVKSGKYAKGAKPTGGSTGTGGSTSTGGPTNPTAPIIGTGEPPIAGSGEVKTTTITKIEEDLKENKEGIKDNTGGSRWDKWKKAFPKLKGPWKIILGGAGLAALYYWYRTHNDNVKLLTFKPCISDLLDDNGTEIAVTKSGDPVVYVKNTGDKEYDANGGLAFYATGRVMYFNGKRKGTYTCQGDEIAIASDQGSQPLNEATGEVSPSDMSKYVDHAASNVRGWVVLSDLKNLSGIMHLLSGKTYKGKNAIAQFIEIYNGTFNSDFIQRVKEIGVQTLGAEGYELKKEILQIASMSSAGDNNPNTGLSKISITWDGDSDGGGGGDQTNTDDDKKDDSKINYHDCSTKNLENGDTIELGCISPYVKKLQECIISRHFELNGGADGKFGPSTAAFLGNVKVIDKALYDQQMAMCSKSTTGTTTGSTATTTGSTTGSTATTTGTTASDKSAENARVADMVNTKDSANKEQEKTPEVQSLIDKGLSIYTNLYNNYKKEGRPKPFIKKDGNRLKYKGELLSQSDLDALNQYIKSLGYSYMKQKDKDYVPGEADEKYVWIKNKEEQPAAEPQQAQQLSEDFIKNIVGKHLRSKI